MKTIEPRPTEVPLARGLLAVESWNPASSNFDGKFPYVDLSAVCQESKRIIGCSFVDRESAPSRARQLVRTGDVLVSTVRPNLNGVAHCAESHPKLTASTGFCVLRVDPGVFCDRYVYHWVRTPRFVSEMVRQATGASYPAVSDRIVKGSGVPYFPLDEQHRIAAILDQADALRDKRRQALAQVEQLTQSVFLEMFRGADCDVRSLGDLLEPIESGKSPVCETRQAHPGEWSVLKLGALSKGFFDPSENKALKPGTEPDERFEVRVGDLLFTRKNTYDLVGTTAIVRETPGRQLLPDLIFRLTPKTDSCLHAEYLNVLFRQARVRGLLQSIASGSSSSMPNISKSRLQSVKLSIPPIALQHEFARRVEAIERLKAAHRRSLKEMDALFASLQHRAFRGEL